MSKLLETIEDYKENAFRKKAPKEIQELMLNATTKLEKMNISKNAKKVGDTLSNVTLKNIDGRDVKLYDFIGENDFLLINFYRGGWCPYCNLELKSLQGELDKFKELNTSLIAISPQTPDSSLTTKQKNELEFEVLSDIQNNVAKQLGLVFSLADELKPIYLSFGIDIPKSNDDESYEIPMPATYLINKEAKVLYAFVDEDYTKRVEPQNILDIIGQNR